MKTTVRTGKWMVAVLSLSAAVAAAQQTTISFENFSGMSYWAGTPVPAASQLSTQLLSSTGVSFRSESAPYIAVVRLGTGHAATGVNGIGGVTSNGLLAYVEPIHARFFLPGNPSVPAVTDFVSIRNDRWADGRMLLTIEAYDINGTLLATNTAIDDRFLILSVTAPGIHSVRISEEFSGGAASFDDFSFNPLVEADPNQAPDADPGASQTLAVAPFVCDNSALASVALDGSQSSDPDGDDLQYEWFLAGETNAIATGVIAAVDLPIGTNYLTLVVSDGLLSDSQIFMVEVVDTLTAIERLMVAMQADWDRAQPLLATLRAALASADRCQSEAAVNQLEAFKNKVLAQVAQIDPVLAGQLLADAQVIIDALNGGAAPSSPLKIDSIARGSNGKAHLKIKGNAARIYMVESSDDMVNWTPLGVATGCGGIDYEYTEDQTASGDRQFYRVVSIGD